MAQDQRYPVVLRFAGLRPEQLKRYEMHRLRHWKEEHCDPDRKHLNGRLIGPENWAQLALDEIDEMRKANFDAELAGLQRNRKAKQLQRRMIEGPKDPWRPTRHGPMREVILTAHRDWFETGGDPDVLFDDAGRQSREAAFEARAIDWLTETFGDDVIHARADRDETTYHIHAVIMPRTVEETTHDTFRRLAPGSHTLLRDYEKAQDSVGKWFARIGLTRGERRADAIREAAKADLPLPELRKHKKTRQWRQEQALKLAADTAKVEAGKAEVATREEAVDTRETAAAARETEVGGREIAVAEREIAAEAKAEEAEAVLAVADEITTGRFAPGGDDDRDQGGEYEPEPKRRARRRLARAVEILTERAREQAKGELRDAYDAIATARLGIEAVLRQLPASARTALEQVHKRMSAGVMAAERIFPKKNILRNQSIERDEQQD